MPGLKERVEGLRSYLWMEFGTLFLALPLTYIFFFPGLPLFGVLAFAVPIVLALLYFEKGFTAKVMLLWRTHPLRQILIRFAVVSGLISILVWIFVPEEFLNIPRERPELMLLILVFYPVFSALPQELLFRTLFFERYVHLFNNIYLAILVNSVLFGIAHILFGNWLAVIASFVLSLVLGWSYYRYRSLFLCVIEHSLYGNFIFFIGIGEYFYKAPV